MGRLIYIPQYPSPMRYQEWWLPEFIKEFKKEYDEVVVIGFRYLWHNNPTRDYDIEMFSPIKKAIEFETAQINEYMTMEIREDDTLFLADISFPGLFCNVLYHKQCPKMFAFCHATSLNAYDYFTPMRKYKSKVEYQHARLFDCIFFGSQYSANKTKWYKHWLPTQVVALPDSPKDLIKPIKQSNIRPIDIVSVCRPSIQKVNKKLEKKVERSLGLKIHREEVNTWNDYSTLLGNSKVLLITTKEDTFNYTILDAIRCGCVPIAPYKLCFPEILDEVYMYESDEDLIPKLKHMLNWKGSIPLPEIKCQDKVDNFFKNIIKRMKR